MSSSRFRPASQTRPAFLRRPHVGMHGQLVDRIGDHVQLYHLGNGARSYSPAIQRFLRMDPFSPFSAGGINAYAFCSGDPVNRTDPSGYLDTGPALDVIAGLLSALVGLALVVTTAGMSAPMLMALSYVAAGFSVISSVLQLAAGATAERHPALSAALGISSNVFQIAAAVIEVSLIAYLALKGTNLVLHFPPRAHRTDLRLGRLPTMVDVAVPHALPPPPRAAMVNASTSPPWRWGSRGSMTSTSRPASPFLWPSGNGQLSLPPHALHSSSRSSSQASSLFLTAPTSLRSSPASSLGRISPLL